MSEQQSPRPDAEGVHARPARRSVASYSTYEEAERAVDYLSDQRFPVERVAIVGHDVKLVEQVVGRLTYGRAAAHGAGGGALTGALFGWVFGLLSWIEPLLASLTLSVYGLVFGAVTGTLIGLLMHVLQGGRRDFSAVSALQPSRYEVLVDTEVADEAARWLQQYQNPQPKDTAS